MNDIANKIIKDNLDKTEEIYQLELQIEALKTENLKLTEQLKNSVVVKQFAEKVNRKAEIECDSDFNISIYNLEALTETIAAEFGKEEDTI